MAPALPVSSSSGSIGSGGDSPSPLPLGAAASAALSDTTPDIEGTHFYPLLALLDPNGQQVGGGEGAGEDGSSPPSPSASSSSWLLHPSVLSGQVIPAFAHTLSNGEAPDVVLLTREDLEQAQPKKKKEVKKPKKGEETSEDELYEAAHFTLSRDLVEALRDRVEAELASAREALIERRRNELEGVDASVAGTADAKKGGAGAKKKAATTAPTKDAVAAASKSKPASASPSTKKPGSAKSSARGGESKPGTPAEGAEDGSSASSSSSPTYPSSLPLHFVLFDLVRTRGDAQRVQEVLAVAIDAYIRLRDADGAKGDGGQTEEATKKDLQEFLYGPPVTRQGGDSSVEERLAREAKEDAVTRAPVPRPHPFDRTVYGIRESHPVPASTATASSSSSSSPPSLLSLLQEATSSDPAFRHLVFLPVTLPTPTAAPTLGASIAVGPNGLVSAQSPPASSRTVKGDKTATAAGAAGAAADKTAASKDSKRTSKGKQSVVDPSQPLTPEQELIARLNQELILSLRELSHSRMEYTRWGARAEVVSLPVATTPLSAVDTRLYSHLLDSMPAGTVNIPAMLYAMFEQVAVRAPPLRSAASAAMTQEEEGETAGSGSAGGAPASSVAPASTAAVSAVPPSLTDLDAFFAGEQLSEVEAFMSSALQRVTFQAEADSPAQSSAAQSAAGWNKSKQQPCTASLGGRHDFEEDQTSSTALSVMRPTSNRTCRACGLDEQSLDSAAAAAPSFLPYGDSYAIRRAEACLALGLPLQPDSVSQAAEQLIADHLLLPGVGRRGMPPHPDEGEGAQQGSDVSSLFQRATTGAGADGEGAIPPEVFERALLLLELEEMLLHPSPPFSYTQHAAKEGGVSAYHTSHARIESAVVEAAVGARLRELHLAEKEKNGGRGFGYGFGFSDQTDSADDKRAWSLEQREYEEDLPPRVLAQRLADALLSPSDTVHTQVRYRAGFDELLVAVHVPTPLTRFRSTVWDHYLAPDMPLQSWIRSPPPVQRLQPTRLYQFLDPHHSGKLALQTMVSFPPDQGRLSVLITQNGEVARAAVMLEKGDLVLTMERVTLGDPEEEEEQERKKMRAAAAAQAAAAAAAPSLTLELEEEDSKSTGNSRPSSRDGTTSRSLNRKSSASRERPTAASKKALPSPKAESLTSRSKAAAAKPATSRKKSSSASAAAATSALEQKDMDDLAAQLSTQLALEQQQRDAEAATEAARLSAPPRVAQETILFQARLAHGGRFVTFGSRTDGSNRTSYTMAHSGLVIELRGKGDEVYMAYPKSALQGGKRWPLAPAKKQGVEREKEQEEEKKDALASSPPSLSSALSVVAESDPSPPSTLSSTLSAVSESFRVVSPNGTVYRVHQDGSAVLLLANGHTARRGPTTEEGAVAEEWEWTDHTGKRVLRRADGRSVTLDPLHCAQQYDAESGATVYTRSDLSLFISYADGSSLAQHADGTRIYTDVLGDAASRPATGRGANMNGSISLSQPRLKVTVEHPNFPPLHFSHALRTQLRESASTSSLHSGVRGVERSNAVQLEVHLPEDGVSLVKHASSDCVSLSHRGGDRFLALTQGHVLYIPASFDVSQLHEGFMEGVGIDLSESDALPRNLYDFDLNLSSSGRVRMQDEEDNVYRASCSGVSHVLLGRDRHARASGEADPIPAAYYPLPANPLPPRLFVVRADGSGTEILHNQQVQAFLKEVEADPNTRALTAERFLSDAADSARSASSASASSGSLQFLTTLSPRPPYSRHPVIPNVIRAAPSGLAAGSSLAVLAATDPLEVLRGINKQAAEQQTPPSMVVRQLLRTPHVTAEDKQRTQMAKHNWLEWKQAQRESEVLYERDALIGASRGGAEVEEEQRVAAEVAQARAAMRSRKQQRQASIPQVDVAAAVPSSRPSTANGHRQPSSQHLLPRPLHEEDEAQQVVQQMLQTLQQPPKTFFPTKPGQQTKKSTTGRSRPTSASTSAATVPPDNLSSFFGQPAFRRDFLLSTLCQRLTELAAPYLPGSRTREEEAGADGSPQSAAEQEELWASLDEDARAHYQDQFHTQLDHLIRACEEFTAHACSFLTRPYDVTLRKLHLQEPPYLSLLTSRSAPPGFTQVVELVANVLGFEREHECYVLTAKDDDTVRENRQRMLSQLRELRDTASMDKKTPDSSRQSASPAAASAQKQSSSEEKESAAPASVDPIDYESMVSSLSGKERAAFESTPAYQQYLAREARLKSIKSTYSTQQHASHGASFQFQSPFAPHNPHLPPQPARTSLPANPLPTTVDVTGAPRKSANRVALPASMAPAAPAQPNQQHLLSELQSGQPRPAPKTSSTAKQTWHSSAAPFASFVLQPSSLDLGVLRKGCTYRSTFTLTNAGHMAGRFAVQQPGNEERTDLLHLRVLYRPGMVAPGMQRRMEVELYAGSVGQVSESITIKTEAQVFTLPLTATVLSDAEYAQRMDGGVGGRNPLSSSSFTASSMQALHLNATYERTYPTSPKKQAMAGPFQLTSSFTHTHSAGPAFSQRGQQAIQPLQQPSFTSTVPRAHFGHTGEIRLLQQGATPHVQQSLSKMQSRAQRGQAQQPHPPTSPPRHSDYDDGRV